MPRLLLTLFTSVLAFSAVTSAQTTPATSTRQLTVEELFKKPALANPILSRSGKYLAAVAPFKGRLNLQVINMETRKGDLLTRYENFDVVNVHWVGDERLIYSLGLYDAPTGPSSVDGGGLFVVGRDGSKPRQLASTIADDIRKLQLVHRTMSFVRQIPGSIDEVMVEGNLSSADSNDLCVLDLNTGKTRLLTLGVQHHDL